MTLTRVCGRGARLVGGGVAVGVGAGLRTVLPPLPTVDALPSSHPLDLPGRGSTYLLDIPGPHPDAPTVVLLHGLACTGPLCWAPTLGHLSDVARVVTFDQRWHGRGICTPEFTLEDCADDVDAVLAALGIEDAIVAGYSLGGAVAQLAWRRAPERIAGLVLCSTTRNSQGNLGERSFFRAMGLAARAVRGHAHGRVLQVRNDLAEPRSMEGPHAFREWARAELRSTSLWTISQTMNALGHFNSAPWIDQVDVPTAVVVTGRDRAIPVRRQHRLAESIPTASVHVAPGGHTSLVLDIERWAPVFVEAVLDVHGRIQQTGVTAPVPRSLP